MFNDLGNRAKRKLIITFRQIVLFLRKVFLPGKVIWFPIEGGVYPCHTGDTLAEYIYLARSFEDEERYFFRALARDAECIVDLGANAGLYTLLAARQNPKAVVISVEASLKEFRKLEELVSRNGLVQVRAHHFAVGEQVGQLFFAEALTRSGALNRIVDESEVLDAHWTRRKVDVRPLDGIIPEAEHGRVGLIKMDVEGHELPVLKGCRNILRKGHPTIMIEMVDKRSSAVSNPSLIWEYMVAQGYSWFGIDQRARKLRLQGSLPKSAYNLFAIHGERITGLRAKHGDLFQG